MYMVAGIGSRRWWLVLSWLLVTASLFAQTSAGAGDDPEKVRKAAQNPVASLISMPVQENWNFNIDPNNRTQNILNIQPVIPTSLGKDWNLIVRWIAPVIFQPNPSTAEGGFYGLGDMNPSFFVSPKEGKVIWGVGPAFVIPTATNTGDLGSGKWSAGPTAVVLVQPGKWTFGGLWNNVWSFAGHERRRDLNQMLFQYFINYNLSKGYFLTWQPTITANWNAPDGSKYVVPLGGGIGRIMKLGTQPVNIGVQVYSNTVHPPGGSAWSLRVQFTLLFPK
jgi:hypothetical protein